MLLSTCTRTMMICTILLSPHCGACATAFLFVLLCRLTGTLLILLRSMPLSTLDGASVVGLLSIV